MCKFFIGFTCDINRYIIGNLHSSTIKEGTEPKKLASQCSKEACLTMFSLVQHLVESSLLTLLLFFPFFLLVKRAFSKRTRLPPSPLKLPFIGNLHQLGSLPHRSLRDLSKKHGPLMLLHLGQVPTLVVSSAEMAREIMKTHDHIFAFRPSLKAAKILLYDSMDLAFAPYGEYWRQLRKLCTLHLLSAKRVHSFELVRQEEVASMLHKISSAATSTGMVDMSEVLYFFTNDVLCRVVSGKFYRGEGRNELFRELIESNSSLFGRFYVEDYFPFLAWMDAFLGLSRKARRNFERWDGLLDEVIKDHADRLKEEVQENDFVDVLLSLQKDPNREFAIREEHMKALLVVSCHVQSFLYILVLFLLDFEISWYVGLVGHGVCIWTFKNPSFEQTNEAERCNVGTQLKKSVSEGHPDKWPSISLMN